MASKWIVLNDGKRIPSVGLGTFQGNYDYSNVFESVVKAIKEAIDIGYRHFDTAFCYNTESAIGKAVCEKIEEGAVAREELFITTKLWSNSHRREDVLLALKKSLQNLSMDYVDMYLIHWPIALKAGEAMMPKDENGQSIFEDDRTDITETWQGMIECQQQGLARSIGVSNFNQTQLKRLIDLGTVTPANNQVEVNPFFANEKLVEFCQKQNIVVSCFSPLGKPNRPWLKENDPTVLNDPMLTRIGKKHNKTASQVALRFLLQRNLVVIPKSSSREHLTENLNIYDFELTVDDMQEIRNSCCSFNFRVLYLKELFGGSKEYPFNED